jgi:hypothetical protein
MLKHPNAFLPVAMSLGALATVVIFLAMHGAAPQADEGAAAHIWQLLMAAQAPIVLYFAIRWLPAITKTSCPHPSPAGRRRISSHGACFLAALVRALSCVRGSASPSRSSVRLTVAPQPRWPERYDSLARAFNGDDNVHASAAHGLRASSIRLDLVPAIVRLDQQGSPHAGSSSVAIGHFLVRWLHEGEGATRQPALGPSDRVQPLTAVHLRRRSQRRVVGRSAAAIALRRETARRPDRP